MRAIRLGVQLAVLPAPWCVRRRVLAKVCGMKLGRESYIGRSLLDCERIELGCYARVGHLTIIKGLEQLALRDHSSIGNLNWITAHPSSDVSFFRGIDRRAVLLLHEHAAVTHRHLIDCTDAVTVGRFSLVAGYRSVILTHSVDIQRGIQDCRPVEIGAFSFVGTGCTLLGGATIGDRCVIAAGSVARGALPGPLLLYGGVPATRIKRLPEGAEFFNRDVGILR